MRGMCRIDLSSNATLPQYCSQLQRKSGMEFSGHVSLRGELLFFWFWCLYLSFDRLNSLVRAEFVASRMPYSSRNLLAERMATTSFIPSRQARNPSTSFFPQQHQRIHRERPPRRYPCSHQSQQGHRQDHPAQYQGIARRRLINNECQHPAR